MHTFINSLDKNDRLLITIGYFILVFFLSKLITLILHKNIHNVVTYYKVKTTFSYLFLILGIIVITYLWTNYVSGNMSTYLGFLSAGIAIALRDIFLNIASWLLIIWKKPFSVGDRIQVGNNFGDVIDQRVFHFTLMEIRNWVDGDQSTGRIVHVPNYKVFSDTVANYTGGFKYIWNELNVTLTLNSDWQKAKELMQNILNEHANHFAIEAGNNVYDASRKYMLYYSKLTPTVYTTVKPSTIQLSLRYLCEPKTRRTTEQELWEKILITLKDETNITLK